MLKIEKHKAYYPFIIITIFMKNLTFKIAERNDSPLILEYIKKLADYEHRLDEVIASESDIEKWVFDEKQAEVIFALLEGEVIGFALYFLSFSTYIGNVNMHLEDLLLNRNIVETVMEKHF